MTRTKLRVHVHNEAIDACLVEIAQRRARLDSDDYGALLSLFQRGLLDGELFQLKVRLEGLKK